LTSRSIDILRRSNWTTDARAHAVDSTRLVSATVTPTSVRQASRTPTLVRSSGRSPLICRRAGSCSRRVSLTSVAVRRRLAARTLNPAARTRPARPRRTRKCRRGGSGGGSLSGSSGFASGGKFEPACARGVDAAKMRSGTISTARAGSPHRWLSSASADEYRRSFS